MCFHVKILVLDGPNRTCKNLENLSADKILMAKMNFFFFFFYSVLRPFQAFPLISRRINR